jgi:hypothetical protein
MDNSKNNQNSSVINFTSGFLLGILINEISNRLNKAKIEQNYLSEKNELKIKSVHFISHIKNNELFDEMFPDYVNVPKVQPSWSYFDKKQVIKINLNNEIVDYLNNKINSYECFEYHFEDFLNIKESDEHLITIDLEFFKTLGDNYIYINYSFNNMDYINVYSENDEILSTHFLYTNNKVISYIKSSISYLENKKEVEVDITDYFNCYSNNDKLLTPEQILLNYDPLDENLENITLNINYPWIKKTYRLNEKINN